MMNDLRETDDGLLGIQESISNPKTKKKKITIVLKAVRTAVQPAAAESLHQVHSADHVGNQWCNGEPRKGK